jgi:hypothetical protein
MQHRLDIAYDDYLYETSWSLQSLTTGTVAATSGFNEVIEFGSFVAVCQLVAGDEQLVTYDSVAGCFYATMDDSHLLITAGSDPPVMSSKRACEMCRASYSE